jgi:hypothetical protein
MHNGDAAAMIDLARQGLESGVRQRRAYRQGERAA